MWFTAKGPARTTVAVEHERLEGPDDAAAEKVRWTERLTALKASRRAETDPVNRRASFHPRIPRESPRNEREGEPLLVIAAQATPSAVVAGVLDPAGPVAERMADLWWIMLALGVLVFAVWTAFFVRAFRRGRSDEGDARPARGGYGSWFVVAGVAIPTVILVVVFVATVVAMQALDDDPPPDALVVEIVGHQWWYEVRYPEAGVETRNELHIPIGRPVAFRLTSADVIHSFWVPELGGKRDLLPDDVSTMVLTADEAGEFQNRCAEFCGLHHATMAMDVVAEPADAFEDWIASR